MSLKTVGCYVTFRPGQTEFWILQHLITFYQKQTFCYKVTKEIVTGEFHNTLGSLFLAIISNIKMKNILPNLDGKLLKFITIKHVQNSSKGSCYLSCWVIDPHFGRWTLTFLSAGKERIVQHSLFWRNYSEESIW